jgi:hypothetical protein
MPSWKECPFFESRRSPFAQVSDVRVWNDQSGDQLTPCQALRVVPPKTREVPAWSSFGGQPGPSHLGLALETPDLITAFYGYTDPRFRLFDWLPPNDSVRRYDVLRKQDCRCSCPTGADRIASDWPQHPGSV